MSGLVSFAPFVLFVLVIGALALTTAVKIVRQYERAVVFNLGKFQGVKGPGLVLLIPHGPRRLRQRRV